MNKQKLEAQTMEKECQDQILSAQESENLQFVPLDIEYILSSRYHPYVQEVEKQSLVLEQRIAQEDPDTQKQDEVQGLSKTKGIAKPKRRYMKKDHKMKERTKIYGTRQLNENSLLQILIRDHYKSTLKHKDKNQANKISLDEKIYEILKDNKSVEQIMTQILGPQSEKLTLCINKQPPYIKLMCQVIKKYANDPLNIRDLLEGQGNIETAVYLEKLIYRWKELMERKNITWERGKEILEGFEKLKFMTKGKVRSECNRNLAQFFTNIVISLVGEKFVSIKNICTQRSNGNFRQQSSIEKLEALLKEIPEEIWQSTLNQMRIYSKINESKKIRQKIILKQYYYCFVPRLNEIRTNPNRTLNIWNFNSFKVQSVEQRQKRDEECSFDTAAKYERGWLRKAEVKIIGEIQQLSMGQNNKEGERFIQDIGQAFNVQA